MHFRPRCVVWVVVFIHLRMETPLPARVAPQGRIHRSFPVHNACIGWYGNAATRTFGRAHGRRPYAFRLGRLHMGGFVYLLGKRCT